MRGHSGERPFKCTQCRWSFRFLLSLNKHNNKYHDCFTVVKRENSAATIKNSTNNWIQGKDNHQQSQIVIEGRNKFICTFSVELLKTLWMFLENLEDCAGWSSSQLARLHPHHRVFSHVEFLHDHTDKTVEAGMCHTDQPDESNYLQVGKNLHRVKWVCQKQTNNDLLRTALYASWQLFVWSLFRPKQLHISGLNCPSIQVDWM